MAEAAVGSAAALFTVWMARFVDLDPLSRVGQVSGLAGLQFQLLLMMAVLLLVLVPLMRRLPELSVQLVSAAFAGLASGVVAAGVSVALRGTPWPLNGQLGDAGQLQIWAQQLVDGKPMESGNYPPLFPHLLAWYAQLAGHGDVGHALKMVDLGFTALLGPFAYLAWRLLLPPLWSLGIGVVSALPLMDPYKPYTCFVLVGLLPLLAKLMQLLQRSPVLARRRAVVLGGALGAVVGLLFLLYSGWFVWSAGGLVVLTLILLVRLGREHGRRALLTGLILLGSTAGAFLVVAGLYVRTFLSASGGDAAIDRYCYFDVYTEPTYFAMWGSDQPGSATLSAWPVPGELAGVSVFVLLLLAGAGLAFALAPRNPVVLASGAAAFSAFAMRYWYASHMFKDDAVMLYPRTSPQLLYCFLVLLGTAVYVGTERLISRRRDPQEGAPAVHRPLPRRVAIAVLCSLGLLFAMAGSSTANRYMPQNPDNWSTGTLAWNAQTQAKANGHCSVYAPSSLCRPSEKMVPVDPSTTVKTKLNCLKENPFPKRSSGPLGRLAGVLAG